MERVWGEKRFEIAVESRRARRREAGQKFFDGEGSVEGSDHEPMVAAIRPLSDFSGCQHVGVKTARCLGSSRLGCSSDG